MADLGGWGSIYCDTWFGDRANIQHSIPQKPDCLLLETSQELIDRVEADGGITEAKACLDNMLYYYGFDYKPSSNLLTDPDSLFSPAWGRLNLLLTDLGSGEFKVEESASPTTGTLDQFYEGVSIGQTYKVSCEFRIKNMSADYRMTVAEYQDGVWKGATNLSLNPLLTINDTAWVKLETQRTLTDALSNQVRFAVQLVSPPDTMSIEVRNPTLEFV